jgi:hypothetical protein
MHFTHVIFTESQSRAAGKCSYDGLEYYYVNARTMVWSTSTEPRTEST